MDFGSKSPNWLTVTYNRTLDIAEDFDALGSLSSLTRAQR